MLPLQAVGDPIGVLTLLLAAFAGGAFGAAIGAFPAFALSGLVIVASEVAAGLGLVTRASGSPLSTGITGQVALGPFLGPHVAFAGGVAATAYAARKGYVDDRHDYYPGKTVTATLWRRPDALAVGGAFGLFGVLVRHLSTAVGLPLDPIALAIVLSAFLHRLALGFPLLGRVRGESILDVTPFERGERRTGPSVAPDGGQPVEESAVTGGRSRSERTVREAGVGIRPSTRLAVEPWVPELYEWLPVALLGVVVGWVGALFMIFTGSQFLAFGLAAATLAVPALTDFLDRQPPSGGLGGEQGAVTEGVEALTVPEWLEPVREWLPDSEYEGSTGIPPTHHMALPGSAAPVALAGGVSALPVLPSLLVGAVFGLVGALAGELAQRTCYAHGDTYADPAAVSILVTSLLIGLLALVGVFAGNAYL